MQGVDHFFNSLEEPYRSCLLYLRSFILSFSEHISEQRKNNTPFYYYNKKWIGFISYDPKTKEIYISFTDGFRINHPMLHSEGRKKMKIFRVDPFEDVDEKSLEELFGIISSLYSQEKTKPRIT